MPVPRSSNNLHHSISKQLHMFGNAGVSISTTKSQYKDCLNLPVTFDKPISWEFQNSIETAELFFCQMDILKKRNPISKNTFSMRPSGLQRTIAVVGYLLPLGGGNILLWCNRCTILIHFDEMKQSNTVSCALRNTWRSFSGLGSCHMCKK